MADGRFHSGEALGRALGVTRAAVWKALKGLDAYQLRVDAVPGRGYRLAEPVELLDSDAVRQRLDAVSAAQLGGLELHLELDSTNAALRRRIHDLPCGHACFAERQVNGRGRRGRPWVSPFARNLYLSLTWHFDGGAAELSGLSLAVAVAVLQALQRSGVPDVGLKWPNDVVVQGRKLAGILLEVSGEENGRWRVVTGVGVNVRMPSQEAAAIDQPWTDVESLRPGVRRNDLAGDLLHELLLAHAQYAQAGFAPFRERWQAADAVAGRPVVLSTPREAFAGRAQGVDDDGALLLDGAAGLQRFTTGEVSLRLDGPDV